MYMRSPDGSIFVEKYKGPQAQVATELFNKLLEIPNPDTITDIALESTIQHAVDRHSFYKNRDTETIKKVLFNSFRKIYKNPSTGF